MGTKILEIRRLSVKRFYGGDHRGVCYQINIGTNYIQVTQKEFDAIIRTLRPFAKRGR